MTETGVVALVGVTATLLSGLGAAWLTNRSTRQRDLDRRAALEQAEIRALIVSALMAARRWGGTIGGIGGALAFAESKQNFQRAFPEYLTSAGSGAEFQDSGDELHRALTEAKLRLEAGALAEAVDAMYALMLRWWQDVLEAMSVDIESESPSVQHRLDLSARYMKQWSDMVTTLEEAARVELPRLSVPGTPPVRRAH